MPGENNKILKYNQNKKFMRARFVIYADLDSLLEKMNPYHNNLEKSSRTKINKHTFSDYSLFTCCSFDTTKSKLDYDRGEDCTKNFCLDLEQHVTKIIKYEEKEMISLTKEEEKIHNKQKMCYICQKDLLLAIVIKYITK